MVELLGPTTVSVREGIRRTIAATQHRIGTTDHMIGQPADGER